MIAEDEKRKEFLSVLGHELRNPLATILSSVELVSALGATAKETPELLAVVTEQVHLMARSLDNLIEVAGVIPRTPDPVTYRGGVPDIQSRTVRGESRKILVVDDNEIAANSLGQLLSLRGYTVEVEYGAVAALKKAILFQPHIAILDIGMPEIDGYELAAMMQRENIRCAYVALTGYGQTHDKKKALESGFDFHLTKPASIKTIEEIIQHICVSLPAERR